MEEFRSDEHERGGCAGTLRVQRPCAKLARQNTKVKRVTLRCSGAQIGAETFT